MKTTKIKELKRIARGNLQGNFIDLIRVSISCTLIISLLEMPFSMMTNEILFSTQNIIYFIALILIDIASVLLKAGQYRLHMQLARKGKVPFSEFFIPIKYHSNALILTEMLLFGISLLSLIPAAISLFLYIGGGTFHVLLAFALLIVSVVLEVYISLTFPLVYFVMLDNEQLSMLKALKYTKDMISSHRGRYLYMQFSFLGMTLLSVLSFGIGFLWTEPYMMQTTTLFYFDVKGELPGILERRQKEEPAPEPVFFNQYI